jgi:hypothetical protein
MSRTCYFSLPKGEEVSHHPIVVATMNNATLSNTYLSLSSKIQGPSHFLCLLPFNEMELRGMAPVSLARHGTQKSRSQFWTFS